MGKALIKAMVENARLEGLPGRAGMPVLGKIL